MRFFAISKLEPGMKLARPVFAPDGRVLLNSGVELEEGFINRLRVLGIPGLYIADEEVPEQIESDIISLKTRFEAMSHLKQAFKCARVGKSLQVGPIHKSVNGIIDEIMQNPKVIVNLTDIRDYDSYTFGHSVNVCVLSVLLGLKLNLNELKVHELAVGALLHDIGKIAVPEEILKKPARLTADEMMMVKRHSEYGFQLLRQHPEISLHSAHAAYQHHERPNGQGYPRSLVDADISLFGKIVGLADAYDAMTAERVYQAGMMPHEAISLIKKLRGIQFSSELVEVFLTCVAPYPIGCLVRLDNHQVGMVMDINQAKPNRPILRMLYDALGDRIGQPYEVDLVKELGVQIVEVIK